MMDPSVKSFFHQIKCLTASSGSNFHLSRDIVTCPVLNSLKFEGEHTE